MKKEHRNFIVLKVKNSWIICYLKKRIAFGFKSKEDAESYKSFLYSR